MNLNYLISNYKRFGALFTLEDLIVSSINRLFYFRIQVIYLYSETEKPSANFDVRQLSRDELLHYATILELDMPRLFIDQALANGDECFGAFNGGELKSYTWCASVPVAFSNGLTAIFGEDFIHPYKGVTVPSARGRGAQKVLTLWLSEHYQRTKNKTLVCAIDMHNLSSRKAQLGSGAVSAGYWIFGLIRSRYISFGTPGCTKLGYKLLQTKALDEQR